MDHHGGEIKVIIDGTPGANDLPSSMVFSTCKDGSAAAAERMRIDSVSGHLLVGKTVTSSNTVGSAFYQTGNIFATVDQNYCMRLNRTGTSNQGEVIQVQASGTEIGVIATQNSNITIHSTGSGKTGLQFDTRVYPMRSNTLSDATTDLGFSSFRFDDIYAENTSIIGTSDENEKQDIASLTSAEITAATAISKLFKTFKWKDAVTKKGDAARTHTGHIAQQVETAMSDAGLDASKYAFWCSNTWWETQTEVAAVEADEENGIEAKDAYTRTDTYDTKDEAPEGATERTRLGIRYAELLAFIGAATEQRLTSIEARLTALEAG